MDASRIVRRKLREAKGELTTRVFARKLGISGGQMSRMLARPTDIPLHTLQKISRALRVTPSQLLDDTDTRHRKK